MSSTYDPLVGHVLDDRYEILAKLARGGMATVYRARDQRLNRTVAVKVMRTDLGEDDEFTAKFDREARAAATLSHPSVVSVFDQGTAQGRPYIVMEYVEGETLRRLISREAPLPPVEAFALLEPIVAALSSAHEAGLVHRDIKPENVLVSSRGQIKVADFGLARLTTSPQMTATGVLVGTASYLPPELVTHSRPDSRSDVYSTGVVAFEMLTGSKPHTGENNYQIAYRHVNVDIEAPSARLADLGHRAWHIPDYVDAFVQACTSRDPGARMDDGHEMLRRVREVRGALARDANADNPNLAARLRPVTNTDFDATQQLSPNPLQRPRPLTPDSGPSLPDGTRLESDEVEPAQGMLAPENVPAWRSRPEEDVADWHEPSPEEAWVPVSPGARPPVTPQGRAVSPVSPHSPDTGPRGSRTPLFPPIHVSSSPVHKRRRTMIALIMVVLLTALAGFGSWWWLEGRWTVVPAMVGISEVDALAAGEANSVRGERTSEYSEDVAKGIVIRTDPTSGSRVLRGEKVTLVVSLGPERFPMPEVVGETLDDARELLAEQNLVAGSVSEAWSETVPQGVVLSASKEPGEQLKRDTVIDLSVSKGREPIPFTDFVGKDAAAAAANLEASGFEVNVTEEHSATVAAGMIISQSPNSGTGHRGDSIELVRSLGPVMVEVPDVRFKTRKTAEEMLTGLGFEVDVQYVTVLPLPLELASGTDPESGTSVPEGSTITLLVS